MNQDLSIQSNHSEIFFGNHGVTALKNFLHKKDYTAIFIAVDTNTQRYCLPRCLALLDGIPIAATLVMEAGEINKNLESCTTFWKALTDGQADRKSALINLGGGVVTDLGGFVAATFKRGIDFYNIPTTLLAMVDAAVGGKTGIDFDVLKNQIGIITEPEMVLVDPFWLKTLPENEIRSGFAEMLKHGLIADADYWKVLSSISSLEIPLLSLGIRTSIEIKNNVVLKDPNEKGWRKILNFGHTLGHAIESFCLLNTDRKTLLHGEAIAIGMILEAYLSIYTCDFNRQDADHIKAVIIRFYGKHTFNNQEIASILTLLRHDKKNSHGSFNFTLLKAVGVPVIDQKVAEDLLIKAFSFYLDA